MRFTATAQKTAVVFVFASFYMRLNANGIGKSHVLKLQMVLKKSVSETGALPYKFRITAFCVECYCCAFYGDGTENSRRFCFRLILHAPQYKWYRETPRFETAKCIEKSHVFKQVRCRTNFKLRLFSM